MTTQDRLNKMFKYLELLNPRSASFVRSVHNQTARKTISKKQAVVIEKIWDESGVNWNHYAN